MNLMLQLIRSRVSLAVAAGSLFGALYFNGADVWHGVLTAVGAGILCAACSALNQVQEHVFDARMQRTQDRPIASGRVSVKSGLALSFGLSLVGLTMFFLFGGWPLLLLGVAVPVIYNGLYTPLKRVTPMALLVGALSGALPPLTGWMGAGGSMFDPTILAVIGIFYLWQVPHFWLLHEKHREDYLRAGFAALDTRLPHHLYRPLLVLWVSAYFLGLGCLVFVSGPGALAWVLPPVILLAGTWAIHAVMNDFRRGAAAAIYGSLPLVLIALLGNTF